MCPGYLMWIFQRFRWNNGALVGGAFTFTIFCGHQYVDNSWDSFLSLLLINWDYTDGKPVQCFSLTASPLWWEDPSDDNNCSAGNCFRSNLLVKRTHSTIKCVEHVVSSKSVLTKKLSLITLKCCRFAIREMLSRYRCFPSRKWSQMTSSKVFGRARCRRMLLLKLLLIIAKSARNLSTRFSGVRSEEILSRHNRFGALEERHSPTFSERSYGRRTVIGACRR